MTGSALIHMDLGRDREPQIAYERWTWSLALTDGGGCVAVARPPYGRRYNTDHGALRACKAVVRRMGLTDVTYRSERVLPEPSPAECSTGTATKPD